MRTEKELLENAVALLKVAACPNCDGSGIAVVQVSDEQCEQQQCQWCDEKNSLIRETEAAQPNTALGRKNEP